jgi:hypothetical protein
VLAIVPYIRKKPFSFVISKTNKAILMNALVLSHIKYASVVWLIPSSNHKSVDNIIKRCARYIYGLLKFDSVSNLISSDLNWFSPNISTNLMF